jgi:hypothetical protein
MGGGACGWQGGAVGQRPTCARAEWEGHRAPGGAAQSLSAGPWTAAPLFARGERPRQIGARLGLDAAREIAQLDHRRSRTNFGSKQPVANGRAPPAQPLPVARRGTRGLRAARLKRNEMSRAKTAKEPQRSASPPRRTPCGRFSPPRRGHRDGAVCFGGAVDRARLSCPRWTIARRRQAAPARRPTRTGSQASPARAAGNSVRGGQPAFANSYDCACDLVTGGQKRAAKRSCCGTRPGAITLAGTF